MQSAWTIDEGLVEAARRWPGLTLEVAAELPSTNGELMQRARLGNAQPTVLVAERQTAGRGRLGRQLGQRCAGPGRQFTHLFAWPAARPARLVGPVARGRRERGRKPVGRARVRPAPQVAQRPVAARSQARRHPHRDGGAAGRIGRAVCGDRHRAQRRAARRRWLAHPACMAAAGASAGHAASCAARADRPAAARRGPLRDPRLCGLRRTLRRA